MLGSEGLLLIAGARTSTRPTTEGADLINIVGGVAAAIAIVSAIFITLRWAYATFKRHRLRGSLREAVRELHRLDNGMRESVVAAEKLFSEGFEWTGYAVFTGPFFDNLQRLQLVVAIERA